MKVHSSLLRLVLRALIISALAIGPALAAHAKQEANFTAHLSGANEVPAVDTQAQGEAIFNLSLDGQSIRYRLIVANIENVRMSHLHLAAEGSNGGVVVWLYPEGPPPVLIEGRVDGVLAVGTISADDLVGELAGMTIDELIGQMLDGNIYVNVHTIAHPGGEIRGQVK